MASDLKRGDRVEWNFGRGKAVGIVKRKLTAPTTIGKQRVAATPEDPRYLVETERSRKTVAKRPGALTRIPKE